MGANNSGAASPSFRELVVEGAALEAPAVNTDELASYGASALEAASDATASVARRAAILEVAYAALGRLAGLARLALEARDVRRQ